MDEPANEGQTKQEKFLEAYHGYILVKILIIVGLLVTVFLVAGYAITLGGREIGFLESYRLLWNHIMGVEYEFRSEDWFKDTILWQLRAPRVLGAIMAGFGLAVCGCVMQSITHNPLADPYTTGMSSGAVFGVSVGIVFGFTINTTHGDLALMLNAFVFSLFPAVLMILIANKGSRSSATIILAGVAVSYIFGSLSTITMMFAEDYKIYSAYLWQLGTLERISSEMLPIMFIGVAVCSTLIYMFSKQLNLLYLGTGTASTLGLDVGTFRAIMIIITSILVATVISFTGVIGFAGLVAPHIMRRFISSDNRYLIPSAGLLGAALLLVCDTIGRVAFLPTELPVGVVMAFVGGPIFLWIIITSRKGVL